MLRGISLEVSQLDYLTKGNIMITVFYVRDEHGIAFEYSTGEPKLSQVMTEFAAECPGYKVALLDDSMLPEVNSDVVYDLLFGKEAPQCC